MPEFHSEPYIYLAGFSHKSALIAWGAFYFKAKSDGRMKLVDDDDLQWVHPPRRTPSARSRRLTVPARVEVRTNRWLVADGSNERSQPLRRVGTETEHPLSIHGFREEPGVGRGDRWNWVPPQRG